MTDISQATFYRSRIKDLSDQAGIMEPMELSRALAELAFQIHSEAAVNMVHKLEYGRVK